MERSDNIGQLTEALAKAQGAFLPILQSEQVDYQGRDGRPGKHYTYAPLVEVIASCRKGLSENGLAILQPTKMVDSKLFVETLLSHSSGEWIKSEICIEPVVKDPQGIGSALTYARRYALSALLGVASEDDDDGQAGMKDGEKKAKAEKVTEILGTATTGGADKEHWCPEHNTAYIGHSNAKGEKWWSHKRDDGTYCNENKGKAKAEVIKPVIVEQSAEIKKQIDDIFGKEPGTEVTGKPPQTGTQSVSDPPKTVIKDKQPLINEAMLRSINGNAKKMNYAGPELSALVKHAYNLDDLHNLTISQGNGLLGMIGRGEKAPETE